MKVGKTNTCSKIFDQDRLVFVQVLTLSWTQIFLQRPLLYRETHVTRHFFVLCFENFCDTNFCKLLTLKIICSTNICENGQNQQKLVLKIKYQAN